MTSSPEPAPEGIYEVTEADVGQRLDALLAHRFPTYSRMRLSALAKEDGVLVYGAPQRGSYRVRLHDRITFVFPSAQAAGPQPQEIPLDILYDDDAIIVVNKPYGMVVHPAKGHWHGTLTSALAFHFGQLSQLGGPTRPGIVHRLDRDTTGVMVVAKTDAAHAELVRQFEQRTVEKEYFAIVRGHVDRDRDTIDLPIGPHPYQREKMTIRGGHPASRPAITFFEVVARWPGLAALRVVPKTGRTHQIRVHLSHRGWPVLCDPLYAGHRQFTLRDIRRNANEDRVLLDRLALHAQRLSFLHPVDRRPLEFAAPLPPTLQQFLADLDTLTGS